MLEHICMFLFQAKYERNYHIFYEMLAGLPSQQKQSFYLQGAETYYYLNQVKVHFYILVTPLNGKSQFWMDLIEICCFVSIQGGECGIIGKDDAEDFLRLRSAMEILHFTPEDQSAVFRVLSSILHLGNVYFQRHEVI